MRDHQTKSLHSFTSIICSGCPGYAQLDFHGPHSLHNGSTRFAFLFSLRDCSASIILQTSMQSRTLTPCIPVVELAPRLLRQLRLLVYGKLWGLFGADGFQTARG